MNVAGALAVKTLGLFEKRIDGDDCLLELARRRFLEAGMGTEMYAVTPDDLDRMMPFRPGPDSPVIVHLARNVNLMEETSRQRIVDFACRFAGRVFGLVLHDDAAMADRRTEYVDAAWKLDDQLEKIPRCPMLFVEYAAGIAPADFARFFSQILDLDRISACLDIGHVGIRAARAAYARKHPGQDVCALKSQSDQWPLLVADVETAVAAGPAEVLELVAALSALKKPVHFHLHDAHPLSTFSPFGVSDHLSFLTEIPLRFEHRGRRSLAPMFGPDGLTKLVARVLELLGPWRSSFTLEIHPTAEGLALGDAASLFSHWTDKTNAERMNHWLAVLRRNHDLLRQAIRTVSSRGDGETAPGPDPKTASLGFETGTLPPL